MVHKIGLLVYKFQTILKYPGEKVIGNSIDNDFLQAIYIKNGVCETFGSFATYVSILWV